LILQCENHFPICVCSFIVLCMAKPRRKSDIRAAAFAEAASLREAARVRAAFLQARPVSWHDVFLKALREGQSITAATRAAGITKSGVYFAKAHTPGFAQRWHAALAEVQAARWASRGQNRSFGSTMNRNSST
jgi:hypothetical protein